MPRPNLLLPRGWICGIWHNYNAHEVHKLQNLWEYIHCNIVLASSQAMVISNVGFRNDAAKDSRTSSEPLFEYPLPGRMNLLKSWARRELSSLDECLVFLLSLYQFHLQKIDVRILFLVNGRTPEQNSQGFKDNTRNGSDGLVLISCGIRSNLACSVQMWTPWRKMKLLCLLSTERNHFCTIWKRWASLWGLILSLATKWRGRP